MMRSKTARNRGIIHSARAWTDAKNSFKVLRLYSNPSSLRPNDTSRPVSIKKMPTPPIHLDDQRNNDTVQNVAYPTRICLGKYPIKEPSLKAPRVKKTRPARSVYESDLSFHQLTCQNGAKRKCHHGGRDDSFTLQVSACPITSDLHRPRLPTG